MRDDTIIDFDVPEGSPDAASADGDGPSLGHRAFVLPLCSSVIMLAVGIALGYRVARWAPPRAGGEVVADTSRAAPAPSAPRGGVATAAAPALADDLPRAHRPGARLRRVECSEELLRDERGLYVGSRWDATDTLFRPGRRKVVLLTMTGCEACRGLLARLAARDLGAGVDLLVFGEEAPPGNHAEVIDALGAHPGWVYAGGVDQSATLSEQFGAERFPAVFVLDERDAILAGWEEDSPRLLDLVQAALREPRAADSRAHQPLASLSLAPSARCARLALGESTRRPATKPPGRPLEARATRRAEPVVAAGAVAATRHTAGAVDVPAIAPARRHEKPEPLERPQPIDPYVNPFVPDTHAVGRERPPAASVPPGRTPAREETTRAAPPPGAGPTPAPPEPERTEVEPGRAPGRRLE